VCKAVWQSGLARQGDSVVSIGDVATRAGVSQTTVSHTLSGKRKVSESVRERVLVAMSELGYVPSRTAQNLAIGRTRILGLVVPDIGNSFFAVLAKGVERAAMDEGYNVILCTTGFDHARELLCLEMVTSRAVDGVIYAAGSTPTSSELSHALGGLPLVLVDEEVPGAHASAFVSDNVEGGRIAACHLLGLGHRRAVVVAGNEDLVSSSRRVDGFTEAWAAGGGEPPQTLIGGFTEEGARTAIEPCLQALRRGEATAVFAANDLMALGVLDALHIAGVDCPRDVSVLGFDDIGPAHYSRPRLSTVRQDVAALGSAAAVALIAALDSPATTVHEWHVLPVELVIRESTGPVRSTSHHNNGKD
jgi:DNA-binding LacI/PurR family transcriptional regulator